MSIQQQASCEEVTVQWNLQDTDSSNDTSETNHQAVVCIESKDHIIHCILFTTKAK